MASRPRRSRRRCSTSPPWASSSSSAEGSPGWTTSTASTRTRCWRCATARRRGGKALQWAITHYDPRFAHTRSPLEDDWLICCEQLDIPKPDDVNVEICGIRVDACYYDAKLIIEFDGTDNHRSPAQVRRDRRNEFKLRTAGWMVLRYSSDLIHDDAPGVRAEVLHHLATRAGLGTGLLPERPPGRRADHRHAALSMPRARRCHRAAPTAPTPDAALSRRARSTPDSRRGAGSAAPPAPATTAASAAGRARARPGRRRARR